MERQMNRVVAAQESSAVQATVNILNNANRETVRVEVPNNIQVNDVPVQLTSTAPPNVDSKPALIPSNDLLDQIKVVEEKAPKPVASNARPMS